MRFTLRISMDGEWYLLGGEQGEFDAQAAGFAVIRERQKAALAEAMRELELAVRHVQRAAAAFSNPIKVQHPDAP